MNASTLSIKYLKDGNQQRLFKFEIYIFQGLNHYRSSMAITSKMQKIFISIPQITSLNLMFFL